ncbi:MAG TPA: hypothetical protein VJ825_06515 [Gemmatimonadaceae bacterium]|nr:hypothetical protein [Gemmatimonadaceae bacterium]
MDLPLVPRIPTDNLYKFVALSGVLMLVVGVALPFVVIYRQDNESRSINAEMDVRSARLSTVVQQLKRSNDFLRGGGSRRSYEAMRDSANRVIDSLTVTEPLIKTRRAAWKEQYDFFDIPVIIGMCMAAAGLLLAVWGFASWYIKLQKPLDALIAKQSASVPAPPDV